MSEVKHSTKRDGKHTAVDDISFTVQDGCIYGLLGPNGAGKSTTMNMITGYLAPTGGTVAIDGHDVQEEPKEAKACIGYLPEIPPLYTDMTVQEYLLFVSELKGKKKKADRVQDVAQAVQRAGLQEMEKRLIRNLSTGYRQRVGIAAALLGSPKVIILDEPTAGQDFRHYTDIMEFLRGLNEQGVTVVMITHDMHLMLEYTPRALVFCDGQLLADRSAAAVLCDPELIEQAALKETSLFTLANRCGIAPAEDFVERFIHEDREVRTHGC